MTLVEGHKDKVLAIISRIKSKQATTDQDVIALRLAGMRDSHLLRRISLNCATGADANRLKEFAMGDAQWIP